MLGGLSVSTLLAALMNLQYKQVWEALDFRTGFVLTVICFGVYWILKPFIFWLMEMHAITLLTYLASSILILALFLWATHTYPEYMQLNSIRPVLQYLACFGILLSLLHFFKLAGKKPKQVQRNAQKQTGL